MQSESQHEEGQSEDADRSATGKLKHAGTKATETGRNKLRRALEKTGKWKEEASGYGGIPLTKQTFALLTGHKHTGHKGSGQVSFPSCSS